MRTHKDSRPAHTVPEPASPRAADELPRALSFALTQRERAAVLRVLRGYGTDRSAALKAALGVDDVSPAGGCSRG